MCPSKLVERRNKEQKVNETTDRNLKARKKKVVQEPVGTKLKRQNTTITCGKCGGLGHNKYHCKNPLVASIAAASAPVDFMVASCSQDMVESNPSDPTC